MTKTLTEQWREGTLPEDCYYILTKNGHIRKERTCFYSHTDEQCFCFTSNKDIEEVLSPVPSYDKVKEMVQKIHILNEQNTKQYNELCEEIKKNNTLEKKLEIATKALSDIEDGYSEDTGAGQIVRQALKEMEGVK